MREYTVVFEKSETGWCAYYPDLPGLASCGETLEETTRLTKEGLDAHLGLMMECNDPIPEPHHIGTHMIFDVPECLERMPELAARAA